MVSQLTDKLRDNTHPQLRRTFFSPFYYPVLRFGGKGRKDDMYINGSPNPPGGPLVSEVGYHPRKKIHIIRVVFQDQAMYARTSFRGAKTCKIGKKGNVFCHIDQFWKGHDALIKKNACKNAYLGSIFIPEKYV